MRLCNSKPFAFHCRAKRLMKENEHRNRKQQQAGNLATAAAPPRDLVIFPLERPTKPKDPALLKAIMTLIPSEGAGSSKFAFKKAKSAGSFFNNNSLLVRTLAQGLHVFKQSLGQSPQSVTGPIEIAAS